MWKGIVNQKFDKDGFAAYVATLQLTTWRPQFAVVHNTSAPTLAQYRGYANRPTPISDHQWLLNLEGYYQGLGWSGGPHLFIVPDGINVFTPLTIPGTHSPSWNSISWGMEMVGEYEEEPFDPGVQDHAIHAIAVLYMWAGLDPHTLKFHKEDPRTTHKTCPGKNVIKTDFVASVIQRIASVNSGEHSPVS